MCIDDVDIFMTKQAIAQFLGGGWGGGTEVFREGKKKGKT
jgi:hypothetical protein